MSKCHDTVLCLISLLLASFGLLKNNHTQWKLRPVLLATVTCWGHLLRPGAFAGEEVPPVPGVASAGTREGGAGGCQTSLFTLAIPSVWNAFSSSCGLAELLLNL